MLRIYSFFVMISLDANEFLCDGGIFDSTIDQLYNCDEFFLQREQVFINFFKKCMASPSNVEGIISVLFGLACGRSKSTRLNSSHLDLSRMPSSA